MAKDIEIKGKSATAAEIAALPKETLGVLYWDETNETWHIGNDKPPSNPVQVVSQTQLTQTVSNASGTRKVQLNTASAVLSEDASGLRSHFHYEAPSPASSTATTATAATVTTAHIAIPPLGTVKTFDVTNFTGKILTIPFDVGVGAAQFKGVVDSQGDQTDDNVIMPHGDTIRFYVDGDGYIQTSIGVDVATQAELDTGLSAKVNTSDIVDNLTSTDTDKPLSAAQGKALQDGKANSTHTHAQSDITNLATDLAAKVDKTGDTMTGQLNISVSSAADSGLASFQHTNGTQGIGFGYNTIAANGSNVNQDLNLTAKGTGSVKAGGSPVLRHSDVNNTLTSSSTTNPLSAAQGKALQDGKAAISGQTFTGDVQSTTAVIADDSGSQRMGLVKQAGSVPELRYLSGNPLKIRRVTAGTIKEPTASVEEAEFGATGGLKLGGKSALTQNTLQTAQTASFTAQWSNAYHVDASSGTITITIDTAVGNTDKTIEIIRIDTTSNSVSVRTSAGERFLNLVSGDNAELFTMSGRGTVELRSNGTHPVVTNTNGIQAVSRLWLPTDAGTDPIAWYNFRDLASLTLDGTAVTTIANLGTGGAGYNITQGTAAAKPTINSATNPLYATFDGSSDWMGTAAAQTNVMNGGTAATLSMLYSASGAKQTSIFDQPGLSTGGQINYHPKWSNNNTYLDLPITSARINADKGTEFANGVTNPIIAIGRRNGANINLYSAGNQTASISGSSASGSPAGSGTVFLGATGVNTNHLNGRIYEVIFHPASLTDDERDREAAYMAWGAGVQNILHTSNPYRLSPPTVAL